MAVHPRETPVVFCSGEDELYGILTSPMTPPRGITVVHVNGKGPTASTVGRGRISVLLTRAFAARGFHGFRLDWRGSGESTGLEREWTLTDLPSAELVDAAGWLDGNGLGNLVLVGTCGGARAVLQAATTTDVRGVGLLNMPVRDYDKDKRFESLPLSQVARRLARRQTLQDLRDPGRRARYVSRARRKAKFLFRGKGGGGPAEYELAGPGLVRALENLVARKVPVLVFYGEGDDDYRDWVAAAAGPLRALLDTGAITVEVIPGRYYDRSSRVLNDELVEAIETHLVGVADGSPPPTA